MKCCKGGKDVYCVVQARPINPISKLENHLTVNSPPTNGHLFAHIHSRNHHPLTKCMFLNWINAMGSSLGLNSLKGHRVHISSTLEYLLQGLPFNIVKSMGLWSSDAFMLYLCKHTTIMAPYLQASPVLEAFTHYTMTIWKLNQVCSYQPSPSDQESFASLDTLWAPSLFGYHSSFQTLSLGSGWWFELKNCWFLPIVHCPLASINLSLLTVAFQCAC